MRVLKLVIASLSVFKLTFFFFKQYMLTAEKLEKSDFGLVNWGKKLINVPGFPTQDSINTESLSTVPHTTDGCFCKLHGGYVAFLLSCLVTFPLNRFLVVALATQGYLK